MYSSNRIIQCCSLFYITDSKVVRVTHKANNLNYSTHYFLRNHFIFALQELYTFLQMVNMVRMKFRKFLIISIFLTFSKDFYNIFYRLKENNNYIKTMLLLFRKKFLVGPLSHFGPKSDVSS